MKGKGRKVWLCILASAAMLAIFASDLKAAETTFDFHGYLEADLPF